MITFFKHQFKYLAVFCSSIWQYFIQECGDVLFMYLANARLGVRYLHMDIISQFNKKIHPHPINSGVFDGDKIRQRLYNEQKERKTKKDRRRRLRGEHHGRQTADGRHHGSGNKGGDNSSPAYCCILVPHAGSFRQLRLRHQNPGNHTQLHLHRTVHMVGILHKRPDPSSAGTPVHDRHRIPDDILVPCENCQVQLYQSGTLPGPDTFSLVSLLSAHGVHTGSDGFRRHVPGKT